MRHTLLMVPAAPQTAGQAQERQTLSAYAFLDPALQVCACPRASDYAGYIETERELWGSVSRGRTENESTSASLGPDGQPVYRSAGITARSSSPAETYFLMPFRGPHDWRPLPHADAPQSLTLNEYRLSHITAVPPGRGCFEGAGVKIMGRSPAQDSGLRKSVEESQ